MSEPHLTFSYPSSTFCCPCPIALCLCLPLHCMIQAVSHADRAHSLLLQTYEKVSSNKALYTKIFAILALFILFFVLFLMWTALLWYVCDSNSDSEKNIIHHVPLLHATYDDQELVHFSNQYHHILLSFTPLILCLDTVVQQLVTKWCTMMCNRSYVFYMHNW